MTAALIQLNPFFETTQTTESLHKIANFRSSKENLQVKRCTIQIVYSPQRPEFLHYDF
jgi:hypothetical protein